MNFLDVLSRTERTCQLLRELIISEPEFNRWEDVGGYSFQSNLLQFFPLTSGPFPLSGENKETMDSAFKIARAFGGGWSKHGDGSWHGECELSELEGQKFTVVLHRVDPPKETRSINLNLEAAQ